MLLASLLMEACSPDGNEPNKLLFVRLDVMPLPTAAALAPLANGLVLVEVKAEAALEV